MALKPDRICLDYAIDYFLDEVQERGKAVTLLSAGSGVSNDQAVHQVTCPADPSGTVAVGILLQDFVDIDRSKYSLNRHRDERQKGSKAAILRKGTVTTDQVASGINPTAGAPAHVGANGFLTTATTGPLLGRFETTKDEDGFVKVSINLP